MVACCHGSAGVTLERLHAAALIDDAASANDARAGVTSVALWVASAGGRAVDFSLCHDVAGNAECLTEAAAALGDPSLTELAVAALVDGARRYELTGLPWPGGNRAGATPALMSGDAAIALAPSSRNLRATTADVARAPRRSSSANAIRKEASGDARRCRRAPADLRSPSPRRRCATLPPPVDAGYEPHALSRRSARTEISPNPRCPNRLAARG